MFVSERPEAFLLVVITFPICLFLALHEIRKQRRIRRELALTEGRVLAEVYRKYAIVLAILVFFSVSFAQLKVQGATHAVERGGEIVYCIDNTKSMDARETVDSPSKIERSRAIALRVVEDLPFAYVAVCALGGSAFWLIPPSQATNDRKILASVINDFIVSQSSFGKGTNILGSLKDVARDVKEKYPDCKDLPLVVVFTDGEETVSHASPDEDIAYIRECGVLFVLVGVGEKGGAKIPHFMDDGQPTGFYETYGGEWYTSFLKEDYLKDVAQRVGGQYFFESERETIARFVQSNLAKTPGRESVLEKSERNISHFFIAPLLILCGVFVKKYIL